MTWEEGEWGAFRDWLVRRGYPDNTTASTLSRVRRLQAGYGDLVALHGRDRLAGLIANLSYSTADERQDRSNPSKVAIVGKLTSGLSSLKNGALLLSQYLDEMNGRPGSASVVQPYVTHSRQSSSDRPTVVQPPSGRGVLAEAVGALGVNLAELVARSSIWAHPDTVAHVASLSPNAAWYPGFRRFRVGESRGTFVDGVRLDDNSRANAAIKLAVFGVRYLEDFHACHVWPRTCYDPRYHTSICNLVLLPAPIAGLSDYEPSVEAALKRRAFELFGWRPEGEPEPERPSDYPEASIWRALVAPSPAVLGALQRRRSTGGTVL